VAIYVLDCGIGNVGAVRSMYRRLGLNAELIAAPRSLARGDMLILPGVGAFDVGASALREHGFFDFIHEAVAQGHRLLGICLGMQLLCRGSEEGGLEGLGIIPADVIRLDPGPERVRIPHMGWNVVEPITDNPLLPKGAEQQRFYFTHSYRVRCDRAEHVWATTHYGTEFPTGIGRARVLGVQFHPEKSHRFGKALLERFAALEMADA
jgi:glutamine amidotransferase